MPPNTPVSQGAGIRACFKGAGTAAPRTPPCARRRPASATPTTDAAPRPAEEADPRRGPRSARPTTGGPAAPARLVLLRNRPVPIGGPRRAGAAAGAAAAPPAASSPGGAGAGAAARTARSARPRTRRAPRVGPVHGDDARGDQRDTLLLASVVDFKCRSADRGRGARGVPRRLSTRSSRRCWRRTAEPRARRRALHQDRARAARHHHRPHEGGRAGDADAPHGRRARQGDGRALSREVAKLFAFWGFGDKATSLGRLAPTSGVTPSRSGRASPCLGGPHRARPALSAHRAQAHEMNRKGGAPRAGLS